MLCISLEGISICNEVNKKNQDSLVLATRHQLLNNKCELIFESLHYYLLFKVQINQQFSRNPPTN